VKARPGLAVTLLALVALASSARLVAEAVRTHAGWDGRDLVAEHQARFAALRRLLPRDGVVGYLSDEPGAAREYFLAQYALAPVVLDPAGARALVVGNFFDPARAPGLAAGQGLVLVADLGAGVMLFRRAGP
jgi:hypothetical protein